MLPVAPDLRSSERPRAWVWWVCGLLLLATMINYMDRLTLNQLSVQIMKAFDLSDRDYGQLESAFGTAFALGAILVGWFADRWSVRWIYAISVLVWSLAGFLTGLAQGFVTLLLCRFLLGLAEAGNWPCALRTTQRILTPAERTMGNSILQSGAAVGAVLTPLLVLGLYQWTGTWRYSFMVVGALGALWVVLWLRSVRTQDLAHPNLPPSPSLMGVMGWLLLLLSMDLVVHIRFREHPWAPLAVKAAVTALGITAVYRWLRACTRDEWSVSGGTFLRRYWVLIVVVAMINITWHFFRAWLPLFLQKQHHYTLEQYSAFSMAYYVATDLGSLTAGFATLGLARRGFTVHGSRVLVYATCAVLTTLTLAAALLPAGPVLLGLLLVIGFASLGLFPTYYSFSQELTVRHQGKVTGALGCSNWLVMALLHEVVGDSVQATGSYSLGVALAGFMPLIGLGALFFFWGKDAPGKMVPVAVSPGVEQAGMHAG